MTFSIETFVGIQDAIAKFSNALLKGDIVAAGTGC